ncbi:sugar phosphate isomerase/epimerase [bacterium]|nr:sugar phosphate isomerase/epimerase [bacterium]
MKRRNFIIGSMSGLATATLVSPATVLASCTPNKKDEKSSVTLNLCLQEGITPGETLAEKLDFMEANGITGIEVGGRGLSNRVDELNDALKNRNIKVGAICAGFDGFILAEDEQKTAFDNTMREIVEAAGKIGSCGVIMVPAFNGQQPCKPHTRETREFLCQQMHDLGEFALQHGTTVILEPLNRNEAHYLRQVADAAAICRDSNSEGVKCMGDFWHMQEETSDYAAFMAAGKKYLQHVHIASRGRRLTPTEDGEKDYYVDGFRALKEIGYEGFVSFECGCEGDRKVVLPAAFEMLRTQWEQA